jgi:ABC-2 type transport system permease protein
VADVAELQLPGVFEQLKLVAGLRWGLMRNSLRQKNNRWDLIGMIIAAASSGLLVIGLCIAFYVGTYFFLTKGQASWIALLFWALFLWWQAFPIFVAGFGASFEFKNLLRFPLSLRAFYLLGLGYGFADLAAISSICWMAAMLVATLVSRISILPAMLLVCALFTLLNVTLERFIGSWLEKVLAKRKAREIFLTIFILSMVSLNFLNPLLRRYGRAGPSKLLGYAHYLDWLPGSLAGHAVAGAATSDYRGVLLGLAGLGAWLLVLSAFLWMRFKAQYMGEELSESSAPEKVKKRIAAGARAPSANGSKDKEARVSAWNRLPFVSPQVAGVMAKEFHYLVRNGFSFVTFLLPPIMVVVFTFNFTGRSSPLKEHAVGPELFFPAIMGYLILIMLAPAYNSFAFENRGIQSYFMAPIRFRDVLLGKNLFLVTVVAVELSVSLGVMVLRVGLPSMPRFFATIAAAVFAVTGQLTIANWSSLSFPKKMEMGKMKGQRNNGVAVWTAFGVQILVGGIATIVLLAGRWFDSPWLPLGAFIALTIATTAGYAASLNSLDRLAEEKKELLIATLCK